MHTLYQLNGICFASLLKKDKNSETYIKNNLWKYHYFLTYLLNKRRHTPLKNGWVKVSCQRLKRELKNSKMGCKNRWFIDRIREDMKRWNIIRSKYENITAGIGITARKTKSKIVDEIIANGWCEWTHNKPIVLDNKEGVFTGIYANILRSLSLVTIDAEAQVFADQALLQRMPLPDKICGWILKKDRWVNEEVHSCWTMSIKAIQCGEFYIKVQYKTSGRVYTHITNFPKVIKHFLRINGKRLVQLDCSCSQPLLLAALMKRELTELTPDIEHYIKLVESGKFYAYIKNLLTENNLPFSDNFKQEFFAKVFYSKEKQFGPWRSLFHQYFPGVSSFILDKKRAVLGEICINDNGRKVKVGGSPELLANKLSLLEAEVMINGVARRLYNENKYGFLTVHDALLVSEELKDLAYNIMLEEYQKLGVKPMIKIENLWEH